MYRGDGGDPGPCIARTPSPVGPGGRWPPAAVWVPPRAPLRSQVPAAGAPRTCGVSWGARSGFPSVSSRGPRRFPIPPVPLSCRRLDCPRARAGKSASPRGLVPPTGCPRKGAGRGDGQRHRALCGGHGLGSGAGCGVWTLTGDGSSPRTWASPGTSRAGAQVLSLVASFSLPLYGCFG